MASERGARFSYHYIARVRRASLAMMTSNVDIARVLQRADIRITVSHVVRWRNEYPQFNRACNDALEEQLEDLAYGLYQAGVEGDTSASKYMLDRLHPAFMPKSKNELTHKGESLEEVLKRRQMTDEELLEQGVITDGKRND